MPDEAGQDGLVGRAELATITAPGWSGVVEVTEDSLHVLLTLRPEGSEVSEPPTATVLRVLADSGVRLEDSDRRRIRSLLTGEGHPASAVERVEVVSGVPPQQGEHGRLEWAADYFSAKQEVEDEERVDHHERGQDLRLVQKGERVLTVVDPGPGVPGRTVFGVELAAIPGNSASVRLGKNVQWDPDGKNLRSTSDGYLVHADGLVDVSAVLEIPGDVDFSVGNIHFNGVVRIKGQIMDGFTVQAEKGIVVGGAIGAATLETAGDADLRSGMAGRGKGVLRVGGQLRAKYLNGLDAEVGGDVEVGREILNCKVQAVGQIRAGRGSICGGQVIALGGVDGYVFGSRMGVKTFVAAGIDYRIAADIDAYRQKIQELQKKSKKIQDSLGPLLVDPVRVRELPPQRQEAVRALVMELKAATTQMEPLKAEMEILESKRDLFREAVIRVGKTLYAGVDIQVGELCRSFTEDIDGPVKIFFQSAERQIKIAATRRR